MHLKTVILWWLLSENYLYFQQYDTSKMFIIILSGFHNISPKGFSYIFLIFYNSTTRCQGKLGPSTSVFTSFFPCKISFPMNTKLSKVNNTITMSMLEYINDQRSTSNLVSVLFLPSNSFLSFSTLFLSNVVIINIIITPLWRPISFSSSSSSLSSSSSSTSPLLWRPISSSSLSSLSPPSGAPP